MPLWYSISHSEKDVRLLNFLCGNFKECHNRRQPLTHYRRTRNFFANSFMILHRCNSDFTPTQIDKKCSFLACLKSKIIRFHSADSMRDPDVHEAVASINPLACKH